MHGPILLAFNLTVKTHSSIPKEDVFTKLDILEHPSIVYNIIISTFQKDIIISFIMAAIKLLFSQLFFNPPSAIAHFLSATAF